MEKMTCETNEFSSIEKSLRICKRSTSLLRSINSGVLDSLKDLLISSGSDVKDVVNAACGALRITPLQLAAAQGDRGIYFVAQLLEHGARANAADKLGRTPLHHAAQEGSSKLVSALLRAGANVDSRFQLDTKAKRSVDDTDCSEVECLYLPAGCKLTLPECWGRTPLHLAVKGGFLDCVKLLIEAGADTNIKDEKGITPILLAGAGVQPNNTNAIERYETIVKLLIEAGADVNVRNVDSGTTPLHHAAILRSVVATQYLLDAGAILLSGQGHVTALHDAASSNCLPVVATLLMHGGHALVNQSDQVGRTPLHRAAYCGARECLLLLIEYGGDLSARTRTNVSVMDAIFSHIPRPINFITTILDESILPNSASINDRAFKIQLDFHVLTPKGFENQMAVVTALISGASDIQLNILLQHPLLQAFIRLKWNSMRIIFFLLLILHVSFVGSISYHILYRVKSKESLEKVEKAQVEVHVEISRRLLLTSVIVLLINVLCQLAIVPKRSLRQLETWLNLVCIVLALGTVLWGESNDTGQTLMATSWILHTESILVLLAWVELMLLIGRFSSWGYYALMFYTVLRNVVKVLLTFVCLVIGFAFSFYIQFQEEAQFCDIWRSFVKTTVMMMGEFDYGDLFTEPKSPNSITRLPATSRIIFLLFVILASIVLMNLMVGLAVSDIQALQTEGHIHRLLKQADFIDQLEKMSNHRILRSNCCPQQLFRILNKRRSIPIRITIQPSNNVRGVARLPYNLLEAVVAIALHNQQLNGIKDRSNYRGMESTEGNHFVKSSEGDKILHILTSLRQEVSDIHQLLGEKPSQSTENQSMNSHFSEAANNVQDVQGVLRRIRNSKYITKKSLHM